MLKPVFSCGQCASFRRTVTLCEPLCAAVCLIWPHLHTDEISCGLNHHPLPRNPKIQTPNTLKAPSVWLPSLTSCLFSHWKTYSACLCTNGSIRCAIIITLSLCCRSVLVCARQCRGAEPFSTCLWESSHSPPLSRFTISIHYSHPIPGPRHTSTCMGTYVRLRNREDGSGVQVFGVFRKTYKPVWHCPDAPSPPS